MQVSKSFSDITLDYGSYHYLYHLESKIFQIYDYISNIEKRRIYISISFMNSIDMAMYSDDHKTTDSLSLRYSDKMSDLLVDPLFIYFCFLKKEKLPNYFYIQDTLLFRLLSCIAHSMLHSFGFDHENAIDKKRMFQHEKNISRLLETSDVYNNK